MNEILLALGIVFTVGGFGGTLTFRQGSLALAGAAGVVLIVLSQIM